jgi:hypothetical protein
MSAVSRAWFPPVTSGWASCTSSKPFREFKSLEGAALQAFLWAMVCFSREERILSAILGDSGFVEETREMV